MPFFRPAFLALASLALVGAVDAPDDVWRNPGNSVHVRFQPCGELVCGTVIWASDKAKADARRGGTDDLIGTQIFRNFRQTRPNLWKGKVYVPDINKTFSGSVTRIGDDKLIGKGCLLLGVGCRSQTWVRIVE